MYTNCFRLLYCHFCSHDGDKGMARKRREKTRYTGIYKQTGNNLYDVKYNFKEIDETTGETKYKAKWVYSIESLDLAKKTLLQLQTASYDDGKITFGEAYDLWLAKARIANYTDLAIKNTGEHIRMIYNFISPDFKLRNVDYSLYSGFIEKCRAEKAYSEYTVSNLRKLIALAWREGQNSYCYCYRFCINGQLPCQQFFFQKWG